MRIFIAGVTGKLGKQLHLSLQTQHEVIGVGSSELDITDFDAVQAILAEHKPDVVINTAAWTHVDGCALEPEKAIAINGLGAQNLAVASYHIGASILQVSSNEVFDGAARRPYYEYDRPNPVNPYGYSKFVGEEAVKQTNPRHYIVRTSWLYAHGGKNFIHSILGAAQAGKSLRVVIDEVANPTYNNDLADALSQLVVTRRYGTYHLSNEGHVSRYAFARYALDRAGWEHINIEPISRHAWSRPSRPPVYTGLANLAGTMLGITLPHWQAGVDAFLQAEGLLVPNRE